MADHKSNRYIKFSQHLTLIYAAVTNLQSSTHCQLLLHHHHNNNNKVYSRATKQQTQLDRRRSISQLCQYRTAAHRTLYAAQH